MHIRVQNSRILFVLLQVHSSNVSSNRIKIQVILLILQIETHCFEWSIFCTTQRLPELLFYMKKSYRILQLQFYKSTHPSTYNLHVHITLQYNPENSPSRIQFYMQKTKSSSSTTTTYRGQRDLYSRFQKRNSTHRRQGDLLEIHPCVLQTFQTFQSFQSFQTFKTLQSFQTFHTFQSFKSFHTFQSFQTFQRHSGHSSHS